MTSSLRHLITRQGRRSSRAWTAAYAASLKWGSKSKVTSSNELQSANGPRDGVRRQDHNSRFFNCEQPDRSSMFSRSRQCVIMRLSRTKCRRPLSIVRPEQLQSLTLRLGLWISVSVSSVSRFILQQSVRESFRRESFRRLGRLRSEAIELNSGHSDMHSSSRLVHSSTSGEPRILETLSFLRELEPRAETWHPTVKIVASARDFICPSLMSCVMDGQSTIASLISWSRPSTQVVSLRFAQLHSARSVKLVNPESCSRFVTKRASR